MNDKELIEYIRNKKYFCCLCADLKKKVLKNGLIEIDNYTGMICGAIEDMFIRRGKYRR